MSDTTSARLPLLDTFFTSQIAAAKALDAERISRSASFIEFVGADGTGSVNQGGVDVIQTFAMQVISEWNEVALFVKIVHDALEAADVADGDGVIRFNGDLQPYLEAAAARYGVKWEDVVKSDVINIDLNALKAHQNEHLERSAIAPNSGFVNDPICTATGHLLVDARDFVMPPRLDVLTFRRAYASIAMREGAFGPGWWSWTECHNDVLDDGTFVFYGPDALKFELHPHGDGTFIGKPDLDVRLVQAGPEAYVLHWGRRSHNPYQVWAFEAGRLIEVTGPFTGSSAFVYGPDGLSRIVHDSGRTLALRWARHRVVAIESSDGRTARFSYDRKGHLVGAANAVSPETYDVDDDGLILTITDADGVRMAANTYDELDRVVEQVLPAGFVTRFDYGGSGTTTLSDGDDNPLSVYTHDEHGRAEMYATGGGFRFTRRFDTLGRVVSQQAADGTSFTLHDSYTHFGRTEEIRWSTGAIDRHTFDHRDRLIESSRPERNMTFEYGDDSAFPSHIAMTGAEGVSIRLRWEHGAPVRVEDGDGVVDTFEIRPDGTIASMTNGYGATTRFDVHPSGVICRIEYADGRVAINERDDAGRLVANVDPAGHRGEMQYSAAGRLLSVTDPAGSVTQLEYDDSGTPCQVVAADGVATDFLFDDQQRPTGVRFANGDAISLELDEFGRPIVVDVAGDRWVTERDGAGRITKQVDPAGKETFQTYGEQIQFSEISDAAGATCRVEMDLARRVTSLKNGAGELKAEYTATGFVRSSSTPGGGAQEFSYTPAGRVATVVEGDVATECRYDDAGQLVAANAGTGWWTFDRDTYGRITRRMSPAGREQRYAYDVLGNLSSIEVDGATWRYQYDPVGRVTATIDPTGRSKSYAYDPMGRMVESRDGAGVATRYEYDLRGRIAAMVDGTGGVVQYTHNPAGHLTSVVDQLGRQTVVGYDPAGTHVATRYLDRDGAAFTPDPLAGMSGADGTVDFGDVTPLARNESADGSVTRWTLPNGEHVELQRDADGLAMRVTSPGFLRTFDRDMCGRVTAVTDETGDVRSVTTLRRDAAGRVVEQAVDGVVTGYEYDDAGQLIRTSGPDGAHEWQYDGAGRLLVERGPEGERRFEYDGAHQLVSLVEGGDVTKFEYDARGRRVRARGRHDIVYVWGQERLEAVIRDGEWTRLGFDGAGRLSRFGDETVKWNDRDLVPEPELIGDKPVITIGSSTFGTVADSGRVEWRPFHVSDAWGDPATSGESGAETPWHDYFGLAVDGVVWLGVRPYDVATRQFLSPDPLAPTPGGSGSTSPYTYAFNDPINFFDPTGRKGEAISIADFNEMAERYSGPQWGAIAELAITVIAVVAIVAVVVVTGGVALGPMIAMGAAAGFASSAAREGLEAWTNTGDGQADAGPVFKATLLGGAGGFLGGVGGRLASPLASAFGRAVPTAVARGGATFVTEGGAGFVEGLVGEAYDAAVPRGMLGSDGDFSLTAAGVNAGINAVTGTAADGVLPRIPGLRGGADIPTGTAADPSSLDLTVSPAPDLPNVAPAGDAGNVDSADGTTGARSGSTGSETGGSDTPDATSTPDASGSTPDASGSTPDATGNTPDPTGNTPDASGGTPDATSTPDATNTPDASGGTPDASGGTPDATNTPDATGDAPGAADDVAAAAVVATPAAAGGAVGTTGANLPGAAGSAPGPNAGPFVNSNAGNPSNRLDDLMNHPRTTSVRTDPQGSTRISRSFRNNEFEYTVNEDGFFERMHFSQTESYSDLPRTRPGSETQAQNDAAARGRDTDQGGHAASYQTSFDQGAINQFPQDANFNNSAYKTWEFERRDWNAHGYHVEGTVEVNQPGGARPDEVTINYVVSDPVTGDVVDFGTATFPNESVHVDPTVVYPRVPNGDMADAPVQFEGRTPTPADATPGDPPAATPTTTDPTSVNGDQASVPAERTQPTREAPTNSGTSADTGGTSGPSTARVAPTASAADPATNGEVPTSAATAQPSSGATATPSTTEVDLATNVAEVDLMATTPDADLTAHLPEGDLTSNGPNRGMAVRPTDVETAAGVTEVDTPAVTEVDTPNVTEVDTPAVTEVDTPNVTEIDTPAVTEIDTPNVTEVDPATNGHAETEPGSRTAASDGDTRPGGPPPPNGPTPEASPPQPPRSAHEIVDEALGDRELFDRHGFDERWTHQALNERINTDPRFLTPEERAVLIEIRDRIPMPAHGEMMQKVLQPADVQNYLDHRVGGRNAPTTIGGSMTRNIDTAHLQSSQELYDALRLDYPGTTFTRDMDSMHVIRFVPRNPEAAVVPQNTTMGGSPRFDQWEWPFTGNGFTSARGDFVPELQTNGTMTMDEGAQMVAITNTGVQRVVATLRDGEWVPEGVAP